MTDEDTSTSSAGEKFFALFLVIGGLLGIGIALYFAPQFLSQHWIYGSVVFVMLAAFGWATYVGILLLRGRRRGWKWATILFASQIPIVSVPGLAYEWYTGFGLSWIFVGDRDPLTFELGSSLSFFLDTRITAVLFGINLFAVLAFIYLIAQRGRWSGSANEESAPEIESDA